MELASTSRPAGRSPHESKASRRERRSPRENGEFVPWFGTVGPDADSLRRMFASLPQKEFGDITIFDNIDKFVPHMYIPSSFWIVGGGEG